MICFYIQVLCQLTQLNKLRVLQAPLKLVLFTDSANDLNVVDILGEFLHELQHAL